MPYLGDSPTNPIPITLTGSGQNVVATAVGEHDKHICWFSVPSQIAGKQMTLSSVFESNWWAGVDILYLWDGSTTAYYINDYINGSGVRAREDFADRNVEPGATVLIALVPRGVDRPAAHTTNGEPVTSGSAKTTADWAAVFAPDLTRRLPASLSLYLNVADVSLYVGSPDQPAVADFITGPNAVSLYKGNKPDFVANITLPAGYGLFVSTPASGERVNLSWPGAVVEELPNGIFLRPANVGVTQQTLRLASPTDSTLPFSYPIVLEMRPYSGVSGVVADDLGTVAGAAVLVFRLGDFIASATTAPNGSYTLPTQLPGGDYIAVALSGTDGRDAVATNFKVLPATRTPYQAPGGNQSPI